jgi:hypothetical protein
MSRGALLVAALALAGCGQQADPVGADSSVAAVTGSVTKGPLQGATVDFYALDGAGNLTGAPLVPSVTTGATGSFTVTGLPAGVPVLVKTSGGSYLDESDTEPDPGLRRRITFAAGENLMAVLPPNQASLAITPYSMALYKKAFIQANGANFANVYDAVRAQAITAFGFDPILTIPADPATGAGGNAQYALILGAAAQVINAIATGAGHLPGHADVMAFVNDLGTDGHIDAGDLNAEIRRFRNNNVAIYGATSLPVVDETILAQPAPVPNAAPVGVPTISGTVTEDLTLTADASGISDANGLGAFSYQWRRQGTAIAGATASTYVLGDADVGFMIGVTVSYVDGAGYAESVTSLAVGPVVNVNDVPTGSPTIAGAPTEGQTLLADTTTLADADGLGTLAYQWLRGGVPIAGATASSYLLVQADVGLLVSVTVSYTDAHGTAESLTSATVGPVANFNDPPTISDMVDGSILEDANTGSLDFTIGDDVTPAASLLFSATSSNTTLVPNVEPTNISYADDGDGDAEFRDLTITPAANQYGSTLITVTVTDGGGLTATDTFTLTVLPVSDAPSAQAFGVQTNEDVPYVFGTAEFNFSDAVDSNGDGSDVDNFAAVLVASLPTAGTLVLNDGVVDNPITTVPFTVTTTDITLGRFKFVPAADQSGVPYAGFSFQVRDDGSTANGGQVDSIAYALTVDVMPVNDAPVAVADSYATSAGTPLVVDASDDPVAPLGLLANDTDIEDGVPATAASAGTPLCVPDPAPAVCSLDTFAADGSFAFTPPAGFAGTMTFTYEAVDSFGAHSAPATVTVTVGPPTEALLPYVTGAGDLKLFDPANPANPLLLASGQPVGFGRRSFVRADIAGSVATNIRPARFVYIKDNGSTRTVWKVNLEAGQDHTPVQISNITDACRLNGSADDFANPDNSIVRVDTAGTDGICNGGSGDDFTTAEAYLVPLTTPSSSSGVQIGLGHCCGITGISDATGVLLGILSSEDDGAGVTFDLVRRNVGSLATPLAVATLDIAGNGQIYADIQRGLGDQHIYLRASPAGGADNNYRLLRYNVATNDLTDLYDYGVTDAALLTSDFDEVTGFDAADLYFTGANGGSLLKVAHAATGAGQAVVLATLPGGHQVVQLQQAGDQLVFQRQGEAGGVYSVPKAGGGVTTLAVNDLTPTVVQLLLTSGSRVYINRVATSTPDFTAYSVNADGTGSRSELDAQWAGQQLGTSCDFNQDCEDTIGIQAVFLRHGASTSDASIELVDPATSVPTGDLFPTVFNVAQGAAVFGGGFGRYTQLTFFAAAEHLDLWLGDTLAADPSAPISALALVANDPGDDQWLFFNEDDGNGPGLTDSDGDGLTDEQEAVLGTNPNSADTDADGLSDFDEVNADGDPSNYAPGVDTDPLDPDTDGDGIPDGTDPAPLGNELPAFANSPVAPYSVALTNASGIGPYQISDANDAAGADIYQVTFTLGGDGGDALAGTLDFTDGLAGGVDTGLGDTIFLGGSFVVVNAPLSRINATLQAADGVTAEPLGLKVVPPAVPFSGRQLLDVLVEDNGHGVLAPASSSLGTALVVNRWELGDVASEQLTRFDGAGVGDMTGQHFAGGGGGDFNGDGRKDFVIGALQDDGTTVAGSGKVYVLFGGGAANNFRTLGGTGAIDPFALGSDIDGSNGFTVVGAAFGDRAGVNATLAGDLDRDGFDDLVLGADSAETSAGVFAGRVYVIFGGQAIPNPLDLANPGTVRMLVVDGPNHLARLGRVGYIGDVNADGFVDLGAAATNADPGGRTNAGALYVIFGGSGICASGQCALGVAALDGSNGFALNGATAGDQVSFVVPRLGDFNGDGIDDIATTATFADPDAGRVDAGQAYVIYGHAAPWPAAVELGSLGAAGVTFNGVTAGDGTGNTIAGLGDFDADGYRDLAIGAQSADPLGRTDAGKAYVLYGGPAYPAVYELGNLPNADGFVIVGSGAGFSLGGRLHGAGDVNGDGLGDLLTGDGDAPGRLNAGRKLILFGQPTRVATTIDAGLIDGRDGFYLNGATAGDFLDGQGTAGDLNADGYVDFALGATQRGTGAGLAYLAFGADFRRTVDSDGDTLSDAYELARGSNPNLADTDGDGIDDGVEVRKLHTDPTAADSDGDGFSDFAEVNIDGDPTDYSPGQGDSNPNDPLSTPTSDADGDGLTDSVEAVLGTDAHDADSDDDGLTDFEEVNRDGNPANYTAGVDTNPTDPDSDNDGVGDGLETGIGSDPVATVNTVVYANAACVSACDGLSWSTGFASQASVLAAVGSGGAAASSTAYVLYAPGTYGSLALTDTARSHVALVGSLGAGVHVPVTPPSTTFDAAGSGSALRLANIDPVTVANIALTGGNNPQGGGVLLDAAATAVTAKLRKVHIHTNVAEQGAGLALLADTPSDDFVEIEDSAITDNTATSTAAADGGGIYMTDGSLTLRRSELARNQTQNLGTGPARGGALFAARAGIGIYIEDSAFTDNRADCAGAIGCAGGAVHLSGAATLFFDMVRSKFLRNVTTGLTDVTSGGGGLYAQGQARLSLSQILFADNQALNGPGGGANAVNASDFNVTDSRFLANRAQRPGGGLHVHPAGTGALVRNNLFVGNVTTDTGGSFGGGVELDSEGGAPMEFSFNTVAFNEVKVPVGPAGGGLSVTGASSTHTIEVHNNNIWFNQYSDPAVPAAGDDFASSVVTVNASGNNINQPPSGSDIQSDPLFVFGFYLDQLASLSVDAASATLSGVFGDTTDPAGTADALPSDIGFHYTDAATGAFSDVNAPQLDAAGNVTAVPVTFSGDNRLPLGAGRLVAACLDDVGSAAGLALSSLTALQPVNLDAAGAAGCRGLASILAQDRGDGSYTVKVVGGGPGTTFTVLYFVDGVGPVSTGLLTIPN